MPLITFPSVEQVNVLVPLNTMVAGEAVMPASFKIPSDLSPDAFLAEVHHLMGIEQGQQVRLGYRVNPSPKSDPFVRFETAEDVSQAVTAVLTRMKRAVSRVVVLELANLVHTCIFICGPTGVGTYVLLI